MSDLIFFINHDNSLFLHTFSFSCIFNLILVSSKANKPYFSILEENVPRKHSQSTNSPNFLENGFQCATVIPRNNAQSDAPRRKEVCCSRAVRMGHECVQGVDQSEDSSEEIAANRRRGEFSGRSVACVRFTQTHPQENYKS